MPDLENVKTTVWEYYRQHGRHDLPWRQPEAGGGFDPYKIMVSEIVLQQTQVNRVIAKYHEFLENFPSLNVLAHTELGNVIRAWSGLGYNRRAKFLHQSAQAIAAGGDFPSSVEGLVALPGIGPNTAGAILAYSFNQPVVFIETNIRTVFLHHCFADADGVPDKAILELVEQSLDTTRPREWYWALMDYGSHLKQTSGNANRRSASYSRQSKFEGSRRQVRGQVLRALQEEPRTLNALSSVISDSRLPAVMDELVQEGLVRHDVGLFSL